MSGYAQFPSALDSYTYRQDINDRVNAFDVNELQDGIESIETTLGVNPQGSASTVAARLNKSMDAAGNIITSSTSADSFQIDSDGTSASPYLSLSGVYDKRLTWVQASNRFELNGPVYVNGTLSLASNTLSGITTLTATTGNITTVTATTGNFTNGRGIFPISGVVAVFKNMAGGATPSITDGWAECNGTTAASQGVTDAVVTATLPNISNGAFIRGSSTSWSSGAASGGADAYNLSHTHGVGSYANALEGTHTHNMQNHTHTYSNTTGAGSIHSHGVGSLQFHVATIDNSGQLYLNTIEGVSSQITYDRNLPAGTGDSYHVWQRNEVATTQHYTANGAGSTANESSHTHSNSGTSNGPSSNTTTEGADHTHSFSGASGSGGSTTQSILPVYFSAVYYLRCK